MKRDQFFSLLLKKWSRRPGFSPDLPGEFESLFLSLGDALLPGEAGGSRREREGEQENEREKSSCDDFAAAMKMSRRTTLPWWAAFFILAATAAAAVAAEDEESAAFLSRHRREPDPLSDAAEARSRRLQEEQKQNRFKPEFRGCEDYDPKVPEESPRGRTTPFFLFFFFILPNIDFFGPNLASFFLLRTLVRWILSLVPGRRWVESKYGLVICLSKFCYL